MGRHESASYLGVSIRNPRPEPVGKLRDTHELWPGGIVGNITPHDHATRQAHAQQLGITIRTPEPYT
jgi:hypothetical protein